MHRYPYGRFCFARSSGSVPRHCTLVSTAYRATLRTRKHVTNTAKSVGPRFGQGTNRIFIYFADSLYLNGLNPHQTYFSRIEEINLVGPELRAILELNPSSLKQGAASDKGRKLTGKSSYLHGIPALRKVCLFANNSSLIQRLLSRQLLLKVGMHCTSRHSSSLSQG